jgi:hypothetical protein
MEKSKEHSGVGKHRSGGLPPVGVPVWVKCEWCRTVAYLDAKGVWRSLSDGKELKDVVSVEWPGRDG